MAIDQVEQVKLRTSSRSCLRACFRACSGCRRNDTRSDCAGCWSRRSGKPSRDQAAQTRCWWPNRLWIGGFVLEDDLCGLVQRLARSAPQC